MKVGIYGYYMGMLLREATPEEWKRYESSLTLDEEMCLAPAVRDGKEYGFEDLNIYMTEMI